MIGIIAKKKEMTQIFTDNGIVIPVTIIEAPPCAITQVKTLKNDGYYAIQLATGTKKNMNKPLLGHLKRVGIKSCRTLFEFRVDDVKQYKVGQKINLSMFEEGEIVNVSGVSKGKGFQGVIKRHGFSGGPKTHGSTSHRVPGSTGASATPARVVKGTKLPGRTGGNRVTVKNLKIVKIYKEKNLIAVSGAIPGSRNGIVFLRKIEKKGKK